MGTLASADDRASLTARIKALTPESRRQWGVMSVGEMVSHLTDSFDVALGTRAFKPVDTWTSRTVMRFFALHVPMKWPQGVPSRPEVLPSKAGTKPGDFEADRQALLERMSAMTDRPSPDQWAAHPVFGRMSTREWLLWGYRHVDHHLRQCGC